MPAFPTQQTFRAFALLLLATPLVAQNRDRGLVDLGPRPQPGERGGFFGTVGLGGGGERYRFSDESEFSETLTKPTVTIRIGGTPSEHVRLGGEIFAWANDDPAGVQSFSVLAMTAQYYPSRTGGLHLRGSLGFARSGTEFSDGGSAYENGFASAYGIGWDIPLSPNITLTPALDIYQGTFSKRGEATLIERVRNLGVQVTFQTGRRRD